MRSVIVIVAPALLAIGTSVIAAVLLDSALRWWGAIACIRAQRAALEEID